MSDFALSPVPNLPGWVETENSPIDASGAQSHTLSIPGDYDLLLVMIQSFDAGGTVQDLQIQDSGDSNINYDVVDAAGSETAGIAGCSVVGATENNFYNISGTLLYGGGRTGGLRIHGPIGDGKAGNTTVTCEHTGSEMPIGQLTFRGSSGNVSIKARVYGWSGL